VTLLRSQARRMVTGPPKKFLSQRILI